MPGDCLNTEGEDPTALGGGSGGSSTPGPGDGVFTDGDSETAIASGDIEAEFRPGQLIANRFAVVRPLGRGGMGAVWEVTDRLTGQRLALKMILPHILAKPNARDRFLKEVTVVRQLRHPGIVTVYDVHEEGHLLFFTMEYLEGRTLRQGMNRRGRLPLDETARILARLCDALAYAHQYTVHRDLSPENVMLLPDGGIKLLDFGIAKTLDPSSFTSSNMAMGKAYYMAPEQRKDAAHIDARADIWSLGVMFFEMLSGEMPMGYASVTDAIPELPPACDDVFRGAVVPVERRFKTLDAFMDALDRCVPNLRLRATRRASKTATPTRTDVPETVVEMCREFVAERKGQWDNAQWLSFCVSVLENPAHAGIQRDTIGQVLEAEKAAWLEEEARRKAEEARLAEARRKAAEEAERKRREAEEARKRAEQARREEEEEARKRAEQARREEEEEARKRREVEAAREADRRKGGQRMAWVMLALAAVLVALILVVRYSDNGTAPNAGNDTRPTPAAPGQSESVQPPSVTQPALPPQVTVTTGQPKPGDVQTVDLGGGVTLELVWIPPGTFTMGSPESEAQRDDDETQHQVTLTQGFWMGKYEVTEAQWQRLVGSIKGDPRLPVETATWHDCQKFLEKLNGRVSGGDFRLPTEAQWEYACRAGTSTPFHFGETISTDQANYNGNYTYGNGRKGVYRKKTTVVGSFPSNAWGLHDMHGNVWEWCSDWYDPEFYSRSPERDPENTAKSEIRVLRGGSWYNSPGFCRSADRTRDNPTLRSYSFGFRVVCVPARS